MGDARARRRGRRASLRALIAGGLSAETDARAVRPPAMVAGGLAVAWLVSTVAIPLPGSPVFAGAGFVASVAITGLTLAAWLLKRPTEFAEALREHRAAGAAAGLLCAAYLVSAVVVGAPLEALVACARVAAVGTFALAIICANRGRALAAPFAWAATALLATYAALFAVGWASPVLKPFVFLILPHQHLAQAPRFAALTWIPGSTGAWALLGVGLVGPVRRRGLRRAMRAAGLLAALATLSPATLALPAVLAAAVLKPGRARVWSTCALAAVGIAPLYVHVLTLEAGGRELTVSRLHPSYETSGLGPEAMPVHEARFFGAAVGFHFTAYAALVARAGSCFAEHPLTGVGPKRFEEVCPVVTMNTYGVWSGHRQPHNQLTELGVELGLTGLALLAAAAWVLGRRMTWEPADRWCVGAAVGLVVCSFSGGLFLSLPAAGYFALHLRERRRLAEATPSCSSGLLVR